MQTTADQSGVGVQNYLEKAAQNLKPVVPIKFHISSRTDSGVHALCNSAHLDIQRAPGKPAFQERELVGCLNHHLKPEPIRILSACRVTDSFHARFSARSRTYIYRLLMGCTHHSEIPVFERDLCWAPTGGYLNVPAMQDAAQFLLGTHDFSTFCSLNSETPFRSPVKTILQADIQPSSGFLSHHYEYRGLEFWELKFKSRSFLYRQVRRMVGALVAVGQGKLAPHHIEELLEMKDARALPPFAMAPSSGLFLKSVEYDEAAEIMADVSWTEGVSNKTAVRLEADFQYSLFTVIYSIVFVLGLIENILALYLLSKKAQHASPSNVYMINLALADTLFVCVLPFKIHYHLNQNDWIFGDVACRITGTLYYINIYVSIVFFTCICVDRYIAVLHPFKYIQIRVTHYVVVATILWVVALTIMVALVLGGPLHNKGLRNTTVCFENFAASSWISRMALYNILALVFGFVIPFSIVLICYPLIARRISQIKHSTRKRKALTTIYVILLICTFCFLPYNLTHFLHFLMRSQVIQNRSFTNVIYKMRRVTLALVSFNCCLNPFLYYFTSSSRTWHFSCRLRFRTKMVYTICDQKLGECSYVYKLHQGCENKKHRDGMN
ncbi:UNVERIFIED_CONTAM: hypothetical protein H355_007310 [Colinus virginianus]|nr:hypothetical protein H355_007310 [Colinus virginianus]